MLKTLKFRTDTLSCLLHVLKDHHSSQEAELSSQIMAHSIHLSIECATVDRVCKMYTRGNSKQRQGEKRGVKLEK